MQSWRWIQSFCYSEVTITTMGHVDFTPTNDLSRLFTPIYILVEVSRGLVALRVIRFETFRTGEQGYSE